MSRVRKYSPGGTIDDFFSKKLSATKFTEKGKEEATKAAVKVRDLFKSKAFKDAYKFDPVSSTYTIDTTKLPEEFKNLEWGGSKNEINKNIFGAFTGRPDGSVKDEENGSEKKFNSLAFNWLNEYVDSQKPAENTKESTYKVNKVIPGAVDYLADANYKGDTKFFQNSWNENKDNFAKKQTLFNSLGINLQNYVKSSENPDGESNYLDKDLAKNLYTQLQGIDVNTDDGWESFKKISAKAGWDVQSLLTAKETLDNDSELKSEQQKLNDLSVLKKSLEDSGISSENAEILAQRGFNPVSDYSNEENPWLKDWLQQYKISVLRNTKGQEMFLKGDGSFLNEDFKNQYSPSYGTSILSNDQGIATIYNPKSHGWDFNRFVDPNAQNQSWRQLEADLPQGMTGWKVYGMGENKGKLGLNLNSDEFIRVQKDDKYEPTTYQKKDGKYYDINTGTLLPITIKGLTPGAAPLTFETSKDLLSTLPDSAAEIKSNNYVSEIRELVPLVDKLEEDFKTPGGGNEEMQNLGNEVMASLKYILETGTTAEKLRAQTLYTRVSELFRTGDWLRTVDRYKNIYNPKNDAPKGNFILSNEPADWVKKLFQKKGGIIKAQGGAVLKKGLTPAEYIAKYKRDISTTIEQPENKHASYGTFRDMDGYDVASLVGTGLSFIPGVGAIGGGIMTAADLAKDLEDGKIDNWGTHFMNAGFTALGFVGLGGLSSLKHLGKAAKGVDAVLDITKAASKVNKLKSTGIVGKTIIELTKTVDNVSDASKILKSTKGKSFETLIEKLSTTKAISNVERNALSKMDISLDKMTRGEASTKIKEAIGKVVGLQNSSSGLSGFLKDVAPSITKLATPERVQKASNAAAMLYGTSVGLPASKDIITDIKDGGLGNIKVDDVVRLGSAASIGSRFIRHKKAVNSVKKQATQTNSDQGFKLTTKDGKNITLKEKVSVPEGSLEVKKSVKGMKKLKSYKDTDITEYTENLQKAGVEKSLAESLGDELKSGKLPKITKIENSGAWELKAEPNLQDGYIRGSQQYEKARKVIANEFLYKDGGKIRKFADGTTGNIGIKKNISLKGLGEGVRKVASNIDNTDISNIAMYFNTLRGNKKATQSQKMAALAGIVESPKMPKQYIRNTSTYTPQAEVEAAKLHSLTKNIAENVSDIDKGMSVRLQGALEANNIRTQARAQDTARFDQIEQMRRDSDRNTLMQNIQAKAADKASVAQAQQQMHLLDSNNQAATTTATNNFITSTNSNMEIGKQKREYSKIYNQLKDPEYKGALENYKKSYTEREKYWRGKHELSQKQLGVEKKVWENSIELEQLRNEQENALKVLTPYMERIKSAQLAMQYGVPIKARGGNISDKKELENLKQKHRMEILKYKQTYINILKDNERMQKALFKVFK